jgi:hypothetical protein
LRSEGVPLRQIGEKIGLSYEQVRLDLRAVDESLFNGSIEDRKRAKSEQIAKLRYAQIESQRAWELSLKDAEKTTEKTTEKGLEKSHTIEGQSGNPGHIRNYVKAVEAESKLLGLYEPEEPGDEGAILIAKTLGAAVDAARKAFGADDDNR